MHSFTQAKTQLPTSWYCTMSVSCRKNAATASRCGDVLKLFCNHELSSCKLILALYLDCFVHSLPIHGQVHTSKTNNCQPAGTVPCMFCSTRCKNCKAYGARVKLCAIMNSTAANCLTLYLACFAVRNSTANCSVMCLPWPYSKCIHCLQMHNFTQTKTTTANQLVLYHECVLQNEMQQLQAYVVRYWNCFAIMNSAVANFLALYLECFVHSLPIHGQVHTSKNNNCQPAGTVPCVFCSTRCKNCRAYGARMKLCCNYELNSCKLFDTVPCLLRSKELNCKLFGYVPSLTIF